MSDLQSENKYAGGGRPRVLITGAAGFLGSHLCEHLVFQGHNVVVLFDARASILVTR